MPQTDLNTHNDNSSDTSAQEMYQGGIITLSVVPGLLLLGAALALLSNAKIFLLMAAVPTLPGFIGAGMLLAGFVAQSRNNKTPASE